MGKPICSTPENSPRRRAGDSSITVVMVIGDCAPASEKPMVRAINNIRVFGTKASSATKNGISAVVASSIFLRPRRSVSTPNWVTTKPATIKVMKIYQPRSSSDQENSSEISVRTKVNKLWSKLAKVTPIRQMKNTRQVCAGTVASARRPPKPRSVGEFSLLLKLPGSPIALYSQA